MEQIDINKKIIYLILDLIILKAIIFTVGYFIGGIF